MRSALDIKPFQENPDSPTVQVKSETIYATLQQLIANALPFFPVVEFNVSAVIPNRSAAATWLRSGQAKER